VLGEIYTYIFLEEEQAKLSNLQDEVSKDVNGLLKHIKANLILGPARRVSVKASRTALDIADV
jgi:hypothetical protein